MSRSNRLEPALAQLADPSRLYSREELSSSDGLPPREAGLYAWYFEGPVASAPVRGCHRASGRALLYVGTAPSRPGSRATLHSRIRQHLRGNLAASTLRKTLACLLAPVGGRAG